MVTPFSYQVRNPGLTGREQRLLSCPAVPADFAFALADLTMLIPKVPDLSPEEVLRRLHVI
jgi:hypothetical protein